MKSCCVGSIPSMFFHAFEAFNVICIFCCLSTSDNCCLSHVTCDCSLVGFKQQPNSALMRAAAAKCIGRKANKRAEAAQCAPEAEMSSQQQWTHTHTRTHSCMRKPINLALFMTE